MLVVEDDAGLRDILVLHLSAEGWNVRETSDGGTALTLSAARPPEVVVLDLSLPGKSGLDVCHALRAELSPSPGIVMVTARSSEADLLLGFESGADDYVLKPCRPREVVARVRAVGNRVRGCGAARVDKGLMERGPLTIDMDARSVVVRGEHALKLTATEFDLLAELAREPERVHSRADLLASVWDLGHPGYARNVDCHVTRLRRKLEAVGVAGKVVRSVHGVGYAFTSPDGA